jgi:hypothetical protein
MAYEEFASDLPRERRFSPELPERIFTLFPPRNAEQFRFF